MVVTDEQVKFYQENGYIVLDGIFTKEQVEKCSQEYDRLFEVKKQEKMDMEATWIGDWTDDKKTKNTTVLSIHNLQCHSAEFTRMLTNENLANAVSRLLGSPNILLHHTKAHVKPPERGSPFPAHQDYYYFPYKKDTMVACFINLDDTEPANGGLAVFPGSHKLGPLENKSSTPLFYYVDQEKYPIEKATPVSAKKGQVIIFSYLTIHASFPNTSTRNRRMFLIQMVTAEDEPLNDAHQSPCQGMVLCGANVKRDANLCNAHNTAPPPQSEQIKA